MEAAVKETCAPVSITSAESGIGRSICEEPVDDVMVEGVGASDGLATVAVGRSDMAAIAKPGAVTSDDWGTSEPWEAEPCTTDAAGRASFTTVGEDVAASHCCSGSSGGCRSGGVAGLD